SEHPRDFQVDADPGGVLARDPAEERAEALLEPLPRGALLVLLREREEEVELARVVVEDGAAREPDLVLEPHDGRALVAEFRERAARAVEDLPAASLHVLLRSLRHGLHFTKPYVRIILCRMLRNRSLLALLVAEL